LSRYTTVTRFDSANEPLHFCILAGGCGYREKSKAPKILQSHHGKSILDIQIDTILECYPKAIISITAGFQADKILREKPAPAIVIENQLWESSNTIEEVRLFLNSTHAKRVLFIDGAVFFNHHAIQITSSPSAFILQVGNESDVGVTLENGVVQNFSYGLKNTWSGLVYLEGKSLDMLRKICSRENNKLILHEGLNLLIDKGVKITGITSDKMETMKL